ncbi:MAG: hypothetical protein ABFE13_01635 [Phycisphaerales bacterium]
MKTSERPASILWRFLEYGGRFGTAAAMAQMHQTVPQFIRWYINAWDGQGGEVLVAINRLRAEKDFIWYQGAFVELLTVATNQVPEYQGCLVTSRKEPMTASDVGSILRVEGRRALAVLTRFESVGLLERVTWPLPGSGEEIPEDGSLRLLHKIAEASRKKVPKGGGKRPFRGQNEGPPFNKSEKSKTDKTKTVEVEETPPCGDDAGPANAAAAAAETGQGPRSLMCPRCGHIGKPAKAAQGWGAKAVQCTQCGHVSRPEAANATSTTSIPSTSPDGGEGPGSPQDRPVGDPGPKALPVSDTPREPHVVRLGDVLAAQGHRYSAEANAFGEQVLAAAGYVTYDRGEFVNEVAHFAKLWDLCCGSLTASAVDKVRAKVLRVAREIASKRHQYRKPEAYLLTTTKNEIRDAKRAHKLQTG